MAAEKQSGRTMLSGIFLSYLVLILHALLILLLGIAVVFFRGVVTYMPWILAGGLLLIAGSTYLFYRRLKKHNRKLRDVLNDPAFRGRPVEISFLGGVASVRIGQPGGEDHRQIEHLPLQEAPQIEGPESQRIKEIDRLGKLRQSNLITEEEFERLKKEILDRHFRQERTI